VLTSGGWSRSGRFSLKNGSVTATPSMLVRPYASLISDGVRAASCWPKVGRYAGESGRR
jgi:hypothetical protein